MMIGDGLLTDITDMIAIAGQTGNTVVTSNRSNIGRSESENRNSDEVGDDDNYGNEELLSGLISHTRRQSDQPQISSIQPPQQQQRSKMIAILTIIMTERRRRREHQSFLFFSRNSRSNSNISSSSSSNNKPLKFSIV
jgi:hypothetical protein